MVNLKRIILDSAAGYNLFDLIIGKFGYSRAKLFAKYCPYTPGMRVLDLGCGPGTATKFFKEDDYLGIDTSSEYIEVAKKRYPLHNFRCSDFGETHEELNREYGSFDIVVAMGLLHHIDDQTAQRYISCCRKILKPGGVLVTFDGCIYEGQSKVRRKVVMSDRGKFIRKKHEYFTLFDKQGFTVRGSIEEEVLLIPHTMLAITARVNLNDASRGEA